LNPYSLHLRARKPFRMAARRFAPAGRMRNPDQSIYYVVQVDHAYHAVQRRKPPMGRKEVGALYQRIELLAVLRAITKLHGHIHRRISRRKPGERSAANQN